METKKLHTQIYEDVIPCRYDTLIQKYFNTLRSGGNKRSYVLN